MLAQGEPSPVLVVNEAAPSAFVLVCEHAGRLVPRALGHLGLDASRLDEHIAWDIGAEGVARRLCGLLDAALVVQRYSRLVIDCNRPPGSPAATPALSDGVRVPGNEGLSDAARALRADAVFHPFHDRLAELLDARAAQGRASILVTVHSFTALFGGTRRPWHFGAQYNRHPDLSRAVNALMARDTSLCIGDNEPYPVNDETHYTIPVHGERRGIPHTMLEICNDLVRTAPEQADWARRLCHVLRDAVRQADGRAMVQGMSNA